jgi:type IV pilus assembly protein PilM
MATPPVGLDITATAITAVVLRKKGKNYSVAQSYTRPLPHGVVVDGEVHDAPALTQALQTMWAEEKIKASSVRIGIANQRCITRIIDLPKIKKKSELKNTIGLQVLDNLPIPLEDAVWDFHTIEDYKDEGGVARQRHIIVMTYRESVERFYEAVQSAGLKVQIDHAGFALMRSGLAALAGEIPPEEEAVSVVALCDIGPTSTNVVIARKGVAELTRIVSFGAELFPQTLSEQFGWSDEDSRRVQYEAGLVPVGGVEAPGDAYADTRRVLQYVAEQFAGELRTSFDYYTHNAGGNVRVSRVVLAGEGALLRGLDSHFANELQVPVSVLDASPRLDSASIEQIGIPHPQFGTALGLAMEDAA